MRGVGNGKLGEWYNCNLTAYHIRRRLSKSEELMVGEVKDIRGTAEGRNKAHGFLMSVSTNPNYPIMEKAVLGELSWSGYP